MILIPSHLCVELQANHRASADASAKGAAEPDHHPVVRLFSPVGRATWLATELGPHDIAFGLADLGFGTPELGYFSLTELQSVILPFSLRIERDLHFESLGPLSLYAETARRVGSILTAERLLRDHRD